MEKHGAASQRTQILHAAAEVRQREFRSAQGLNKPGFYRRRQDFRFGRFAGPRIGRRENVKGLARKSAELPWGWEPWVKGRCSDTCVDPAGQPMEARTVAANL